MRCSECEEYEVWVTSDVYKKMGYWYCMRCKK